MRMRYLAFVLAAAIAALAMQNGTATKSAPLSVATVNIMGLQMAADKNLPEMVIAEPY
jgi:hypothetical protein